LFLKKLQNSSGSIFKNQPIIAVTGRADLDREVYTKAGFSHVVSKPYSPRHLLEIINSIYTKSEFPLNRDHVDDTEADPTKAYSLVSLRTFMSNEDNALNELLLLFKETTIENLVLLEEGIAKKNELNIKNIAHRMAPMFKQIEAHEIHSIIHDFENKEASYEEMEVNFQSVKEKIKALFFLLDKEII